MRDQGGCAVLLICAGLVGLVCYGVASALRDLFHLIFR
jgi:hypothetical protein